MKKREKAKGATSHLKARKRKKPRQEKANREQIHKMAVTNKMETKAVAIQKTVLAQPRVQTMAKTRMATTQQENPAFQKRLPGIDRRWNGCAASSYKQPRSWNAHRGIFLRISRALWRSSASQNCHGGNCFGNLSQAAMAAPAAGCLQNADMLVEEYIFPVLEITNCPM